MPISEFEIGEHLLTANGSLATVRSLTKRPQRETVYNIEVDAEHVYYVGQSGVLVHNTCGPHNRVRWVDENAAMSKRARKYDDGAIGARSNALTKMPQAPQLMRTLEDGVTRGVRFDGLDGDILIDRKISVVTTRKAKGQALRQSQALSENGLTGRWEVPTDAQARRAQRMFEELEIDNIEVKVVNE